MKSTFLVSIHTYRDDIFAFSILSNFENSCVLSAATKLIKFQTVFFVFVFFFVKRRNAAA